MRDPLTEIARKALSVTQARAAREGLDLFEELNRVGLLATEPRIREIQVSALQNMLDRLASMQPAELLRETQTWNSNPLTTQDMYNSVLDWVNSYIGQVILNR
jgi:hypothetical protein